MEFQIVNFFLSLPDQKRIWGELFLLVSMRVMNPKDNQDMTLTRIVTEKSDGKRKTVYKLEIDTEE